MFMYKGIKQNVINAQVKSLTQQVKIHFLCWKGMVFLKMAQILQIAFADA